jgi:hypothetical protein
MYIGGKQARPDSGYSQPVYSPKGKLLGHVGIGNRKDIRNAVEAAHAAKSWAKTTAYNRAQVLYFIAENLSARPPSSPNACKTSPANPAQPRSTPPSSASSPTPPGPTNTTAPPNPSRSAASPLR